MRLERLSKANAQYFDTAFSLYESAFPREERRDISEQKRAMENPNYHFDLILDGEKFYGVMLYWETDGLIYLEHFTTMPEVRGKGYGAKALDLLKEKNKIVLLEIEPPVDEFTQRRYGFYQRNGFIMNPYYHIQAKYHLGDEDLELKILSYPRVLKDEEYRDFYEYMTREIGIKANSSTEVTVRALKATDDLKQVAKLIYETDPYIYPNWFDDKSDGIKVISEMLLLPTLYNIENVTVAVDRNGFIAGMAVAKETPFVEEKESIALAFQRAGVKMDERTEQVYKDYYAKMGDANDGYYLANLAVDENHRKKGVASALLKEITKNKEKCTLECVVANSGSWRLYLRHGFRVEYEYPGVHGIPCYKMVYGG